MGLAELADVIKALLVAVNFFCILLTVTHAGPKAKKALTKRSNHVLVVTAHPDDECMFFGPTILNLQPDHKIFVLCLSSGDYEGLAKVREKELFASCQTLGVPADRVILHGGRAFPDHPSTVWDTDQVAKVLVEAIQRVNAGAVITFDKYGVSGHLNHIAIHDGLQRIVETKLLPEGVAALTLESTSLLRKFIGWLDVPLSMLSPRSCFASTEQVDRTRQAMYKHTSQMVWFRHVYVFLSRYMYMNTLQVLHPGCVSDTLESTNKIEGETESQ